MSNNRFFGYPNRLYCEVLDEMRKVIGTRTALTVASAERSNTILLSLCEELQVYGNRMEAGLGTIKDIRELRDKINKEKVVLKKLNEKVDKLKPDEE